jgi:hypothetical protein
MNNIVNITATEHIAAPNPNPEKKSLASRFRMWQDRRIKQENREISNRMFTQ